MAREQRVYAVYIMASGKNGTLYIGVTGNLISRVVQHKAKEISGFTARHKITQLVWWEDFEDVQLAIQREKTMKKWLRQWKINLIEATNPGWKDLSHHLFSSSP